MMLVTENGERREVDAVETTTPAGGAGVGGKRVRTQEGCFVVGSTGGRFWDGEGWVADPNQALPFAFTADPWADCHAVVEELRRRGHRCLVGYLPWREVRAAA